MDKDNDRYLEALNGWLKRETTIRDEKKIYNLVCAIV